MTDLDKVLSIVSKHYQEWEQHPTRMENGYEHESTFASMTQEMEKEILKISLGEMPISRNDKKKRLQDLEHLRWVHDKLHLNVKLSFFEKIKRSKINRFESVNFL